MTGFRWNVFVCVSVMLGGVPGAVGVEGAGHGPDVILGDMRSILRHGRVGDITAFSLGMEACNIGDERVNWIAQTNEHPVAFQNMYRLKDGRFEQIGMSWVWHGFYAVTQDLCNQCEDQTDGSELGVGCSSPSSASLNGVQQNMSRRSGINAHTGWFDYPWSAPDAAETIGRRIQVLDADIDPSLNVAAQYFIEGHFVAADDAAAGNGNNNASYRTVDVSERWPDVFEFAPTGETQREQPAIRAWQDTDPNVVETDIQVPGEGLFIIAARATDLRGGRWHYEYALQNLNSDRAAGSVSVPLPTGSPVWNIGFHDVDYHSGEVFSGADWEATVTDGAITWATEDHDDNPNANALRFSTLYNFRFDTDRAPVWSEITIGLFKPGTPAAIVVRTLAPAAADPHDLDGDGVQDDVDNCLEMSNPPQADHDDDDIGDKCDPDIDNDGVVNSVDVCDHTPLHSSVGCDGTLRTDVDADCDVDLMDYSIIQLEYTGPG